MKGHPFAGAVFGFLFGLFLAGFLLTIGALATDSILHLVLPVVFALLGIALAGIAPFRRSRLRTAGAGVGPNEHPLVTESPAAPPAAPPPAEGS
jgi:hypothetical protein